MNGKTKDQPPPGHIVALSQQNVSELSSICERFLMDRHQVKISSETLRIILPKMLSRIVDHYRVNPPLPPVNEINKIALMQIKEFALDQQRSRGQAAGPLGPPDPPAHRSQQPHMSPAVATSSRLGVLEESYNDSEGEDPTMLGPATGRDMPAIEIKEQAVTEDEFFKRLQQFEI